jgi:uncharacterized protein YndB with AHSA1/START domain
MEKNTITATVLVKAPLAEVWSFWTLPAHIMHWNQPSDGWHTTRVENDPRSGGRFLFVMKAKDGSDHFDYKGTYEEVVIHERIHYTLSDGRTTTVVFTETAAGTTISEIFEPTPGIPEADQQHFCASVLDTFRAYVESPRSGGSK